MKAICLSAPIQNSEAGEFVGRQAVRSGDGQQMLNGRSNCAGDGWFTCFTRNSIGHCRQACVNAAIVTTGDELGNRAKN